MVDEEMRAKIGKIGVDAAKAVDYHSAGTIEGLFVKQDDGPDEYFFLEMNTRVQVEHCVTEATTGIDIVREQILIAAGEELTIKQEDVQLRGHAIECRINAEDPRTFMPSPGLVKQYHAPGGMHVRVDSGLYAGYRVPPYYDSMIAKLIVYGTTRQGALRRLRRALEEFVIDGFKTTIPLHQALIEDPERAAVAGAVAREAALARYSLGRFHRDWDELLGDLAVAPRTLSTAGTREGSTR